MHSDFVLVHLTRAVPKVVPSFPVGCRRLTPGPGYLEALCEDNVRIVGIAGRWSLLKSLQVSFVPKNIQRITPTGLETTDGERYDLDILICATGEFYVVSVAKCINDDLTKVMTRVTSFPSLSSSGWSHVAGTIPPSSGHVSLSMH